MTISEQPKPSTPPHSTRSQPDSDRTLEVLLADYTAGRDDERSLTATQAAVFSIAIAVAGLIMASVSQTCGFIPTRTSCLMLPQYALAAAPLLPLALFGYLIMQGALSIFRGFYLRGLEEEIRKRSPQHIESLGAVWPASYVGIAVGYTSLHRGSVFYRIISGLIMFIVIATFGGLTVYIGFHVDPIYQVAMVVVYGGSFVVLLSEIFQLTFRARDRFAKLATSYITATDSILPQAGLSEEEKVKERSLTSYLIYPRPEDWIKPAIAPGVFITIAWSMGTLDHWKRFLVLWFILEYLIYNARYQWNDCRGVTEDLQSSQKRSRARLPVGPGSVHVRRNINLTMTAAAVRIAVALILGVIIHSAEPVAILLALVLGIAIPYEYLRHDLSERQVIKLEWRLIVLWTIVGLGYAVRAGLAFWVAGLSRAGLAAAAGLVCFAAFGTMFVLVTWVLEAANYCSIDATGKWYATGQAASKTHLAPLLTYCNIVPTIGPIPEVRVRSGAEETVAEPRGRLLSPWNISLCVSLLFGAALAIYVSHVGITWPRYIICALIYLGGAISLMACNKSWQRYAVLLTVMGVAEAYSSFLDWQEYSALIPLIWLVISGSYTVFRSNSYQKLKNFAPDLLARILFTWVTTTRALSVIVLGRATIEEIDRVEQRRRREHDARARRLADASRLRLDQIRDALGPDGPSR